jgi:hypothetical protein
MGALLGVLHPETSVRGAIGLTVAALAAAAWFTKSYTMRVRNQQAGTETEGLGRVLRSRRQPGPESQGSRRPD